MEWNKWNILDIDKTIGFSLAFLIGLSYILALLYYFVAFNVFDNSYLTQSIIDFNSYVMEIFPGVKSISTINEQKYGDGRLVAYMHGIAALCVVPFVSIAVVLIAIKYNLWTPYPQGDELYVKDYLYTFVSYLIFGWLFVNLLYDTSPSRAWHYRTFTAIMIPTGIGLYISTIPVLMINNIIYFYRDKFSSQKEK